MGYNADLKLSTDAYITMHTCIRLMISFGCLTDLKNDLSQLEIAD